jgi:transcriptional regulator with XRE-family HTH domain
MQADSIQPEFWQNHPYISGMPGGRPPQKPQPIFGQRLAALRKLRGLSQPRFAKLMSMSREMITYYERRAQNPTSEFLQKASAVLGVTVNEMLGQQAKTVHKPGPRSEVEARLDAVRKLPRRRQKFVLDFIDTVLRDSVTVTANGH